NVQLNVERRAHGRDTSTDKRIVADSEVAAVQLCLGVERSPLTAPQVLFVATVPQVEFDRPAPTVQRELTGHHPAVTLLPADPGTDELDQRVCLDVQEISGSKMIVAHTDPGIDRTRLDLGTDRRILHRGPHVDPATQFPEVGSDAGYTEMPCRGSNRRVNRIDRPRPRGGQLDRDRLRLQCNVTERAAPVSRDLRHPRCGEIHTSRQDSRVDTGRQRCGRRRTLRIDLDPSELTARQISHGEHGIADRAPGRRHGACPQTLCRTHAPTCPLCRLTASPWPSRTSWAVCSLARLTRLVAGG